jgi:TRAP-type mannitol/chloroaromatic compound transport system permease small subunit
MTLLLKIADIFDRPARSLGKLGGWVILPLIAIIIFDVITRKFDSVRIWMAELNLPWFNPIIFQDAEWHLHGILLLLSFGYGYLMNAHVRVDIFREMVSPRKQAWIEFWGLLLLGIPFLILITYFAWEFVALSFHQHEGSESLTGIPMRYIVKSFLIIGFFLLLLAFVATFLRIVVFLFGDEEARARAQSQLAIFPDELSGEEAGDVLAHEARAAKEHK